MPAMPTRLRISTLLVSLAIPAWMAGCKGEVDRAPKAQVSEPAPAAAEAQAAEAVAGDGEGDAGAPGLPAGALAIDPAESRVGFVGAKVTAEHEGRFSEFEGHVVLDGETPTGLAVTVQTASVEISPGMLERHLKSDDFFAVDEYPTATFSSTKIEAKVDGEATHEITGNLALRGIEKQVVFPARVEVGADAVTGTAEFAIDRKLWGIEYRGMKDDLIEDEVVLEIRLVAARG